MKQQQQQQQLEVKGQMVLYTADVTGGSTSSSR
jgi:hypothetical protein